MSGQLDKKLRSVQPTLAVVIPAYNEQDTVSEIVRVALELTPDVVVASDGSIDDTVRVAEQAGAKALDLQPNVGKGAALKAALQATSAEYVVMLDADLTGLSVLHLHMLLEPVLQGRADMSIGIFEGGGLLTDLGNQLTPNLSGQRACKREWLLSVKHLEERWPEPAITAHLKNTKATWEYVELSQVAQVVKEKKRGLTEGVKARVKMYVNLLTFFVRKKR